MGLFLLCSRMDYVMPLFLEKCREHCAFRGGAVFEEGNICREILW
ncbi:hypothetical protein HMPREF1986_01406 [Oribacterium sp. oral taxon 078 str. F0263]|nr:hypothetical protein HMPREF1986_01406 [Oribacterium sp. oral taxon 078 str. F0263]